MSLAEHVYVGTTQPANPVVGAVWVDSTNEKLFRCSSIGPDVWTEISPASGGGGGAINDLSDVTITAVSSGEVLEWNGAAWINRTLVEAGISAPGHAHVEADITDLGSYSVVGHAHLEGDITDLQAYLLDITGELLSALSDVAITSIGANEILQWNGAVWINQTLAEAAIAAASHTHTESEITNLAHVITVRKNSGADVGTRARLNFIEGANITLTVADDSGSGEVDVTIAASGGGGGGADVKSGLETAITENTTRSVVFGAAFSGTPNVVGTIADSSARDTLIAIRSITVNGFDIFVHKVAGGGAADRDVQWIATDAGNP